MASAHKRNTTSMQKSPRCGAKTRSGEPCKAPAVNGNTRCRMHGGANGSGAPHGNQNAFKHGGYSKDYITRMRLARTLMRDARDLSSSERK